MSVNEGAGSGGSGDNNIVWFLYTGQPIEEIPRDVTHVRIAPYVKKIGIGAFRDCEQLMVVELNVGLEEIGESAFEGCKSLKYIKVPSTVKKIGESAFHECNQLSDVELCEGLEEIAGWAFCVCHSLHCIKVPSTAKNIGGWAFSGCDLLLEVELCEGLEEIKTGAFNNCKSLKRFKVPYTVKRICGSAFHGCELLEEVELCEGLEEIGRHAFFNCKYLKRFNVPSSVKVIDIGAFSGCEELVEVELLDGIEKIKERAFKRCKSLKCLKVPSTVKKIGMYAFDGCHQLVAVELCEGLRKINERAFNGCQSLKYMQIPSTVTFIGGAAFCGCEQLVGVGLCGTVEKIGVGAFRNCFSLRNVALPPVTPLNCFEPGCHDLLRYFGSHEIIYDSLESRFEGLPVHRLCYFQSHYPADVTIRRINSITERNEGPFNLSNNQDCLGMTPLHILVCSSKPNLELCQFITDRYPNSLITEDEWDSLPVLYAIWGGAPQEIVQFLINSQKSVFPNHILDWDKMIETLCRAGASLDTVMLLLDTHQASYSEQSIDWRRAARELTLRFLMECDYRDDWEESFFEDWGAMMASFTALTHQELIRSLMETRQRFFADQNDVNYVNLQLVCEDLVQPLNGWWRPHEDDKCRSMESFQFLVKCNIAERLGTIGVRTWRVHIKNLVEGVSTFQLSKLYDYFDTIHLKLLAYEREYPRLKDDAFLLELALWKTKIDELDDDNADARRQCRINCGANVIIPNVLPYLISNEEQHTASDEDDGESDESNSEDFDSSSDEDY